jgi:hypothetical protein
MSIVQSSQEKILQTAAAHGAFSDAIIDMLHWFQTATAGDRAEADFETNYQGIDAALAAATVDSPLHPQLTNGWALYVKGLREAYSNFGRDVVTRLGVDETAQVRNLACQQDRLKLPVDWFQVDETAQVRNLAYSIANHAFQDARRRARDFLISQIEAAVLKPRS